MSEYSNSDPLVAAAAAANAAGMHLPDGVDAHSLAQSASRLAASAATTAAAALAGAFTAGSAQTLHHAFGGMDHGNMPGMDHGGMDHGGMPGMDHGGMPGMDHGAPSNGSARACKVSMLFSWSPPVHGECVIFPAWQLNTPLDFYASFAGIVALGAFVELLRLRIRQMDARLARTLIERGAGAFAPPGGGMSVNGSGRGAFGSGAAKRRSASLLPTSHPHSHSQARYDAAADGMQSEGSTSSHGSSASEGGADARSAEVRGLLGKTGKAGGAGRSAGARKDGGGEASYL